QQPKRSSLHYLTPYHERLTLPRYLKVPHPAYFTTKCPIQSKEKSTQNPRVSSKALMQPFPTGWMKGNLAELQFGGWVAIGGAGRSPRELCPPTRAFQRGGAPPLPPPGTEHLRQCWWRDQRGAR